MHSVYTQVDKKVLRGSEHGLRQGVELIRGFSMLRLWLLFQAAVSRNLAVRLSRPHALALR